MDSPIIEKISLKGNYAAMLPHGLPPEIIERQEDERRWGLEKGVGGG
jgi:hypothetical protein